MAGEATLFVIAAPSGAGKTTLVHAMVAKHPELRFSISYTTRKPRRNEANGVDYLFVNEEEFMRLRDQGEMLEYAEVFDHHYATSRSQVEKHLADNRNVILEIDWQGARQVRAAYPDATSIFILPPSRAALVQRLEGRGLDAANVIEARSDKAREEISHYGEYDYLVVNDDFATALSELTQIIAASRLGLQPQRERLGALLKDLLRQE